VSHPQPSSEHQPPGSVRIGRVAGVAVYVRASWVIIAVVIAILLEPRVDEVQPGLGAWKYAAGFVFAALLYGAILLHEMSHAVVAQRLGLQVRSISLHFLGGSTEIEGESRTAGEEFKIAVVGPLTSVAIGLAALGLLQLDPSGLTRLALEGIAGSNLVIGVLNLVPGLPLDGGRVLKSAVWRIGGNVHRGTIVAAWGGRVVGGLVLLYPVALRLFAETAPSTYEYVFAFIMASFLWSGATASLMNARLRLRLPALQARSLARRAVAVPDDLPVSEAVRRAQDAAAGGIVTQASNGTLVSIVSETALLALPDERRPWVPVSSVSRTLAAGLVLPADLGGEDLIRAMSRTPAAEYVLVEPDGSLYGLLVTADVDTAFEAGAGR
jgi:Zn-dependent protease